MLMYDVIEKKKRGRPKKDTVVTTEKVEEIKAVENVIEKPKKIKRTLKSK